MKSVPQISRLYPFSVWLLVISFITVASLNGQVKISEQSWVIPTYKVSAPDKNPAFFKGEVYQGASKYIYPYALNDMISNEKTDQAWKALILENEYIKLCVTPEIGGKLYYGTDKTNNYNFIYKNDVVKPTNIGMTGAWVSGGIEWCVIHHHRASTFLPVDYTLAENKDGSKTIWIGETEPRHRMKWTIGITAYPGKSYYSAEVKIHNPTSLTNTFLYWANVAAHTNKDYQVIFPPSVNMATYHAKNSFTNWPISTEVYNGEDFTKGVDLSGPASPVARREILLSLLDQPLLKLTDVSHVTFRGLAFEATRGNAIEINGGVGNRIAGCLIRNVGDSGVVISGGSGHGVVGCDISDAGDGGVSLTGGDRQSLKPGGHFAENCHFQRLGRWSKCYVPAVAMTGVGLRASHNLIHDLPHCAILYWGNDHVMEFNEIHHIALETGDVGAIYTGRDYTFRGNKVWRNYIHHTGGVGMGSMGVYMDDCVSGTEVFGNVFYKVHWAMFIGGGRDHRVENNLFVDCDPAVRADGRGLDKSPVWHSMVDDTMRKRLAEVPLARYRQRYPEMKSLDRFYGPPDGPAITGEAFKGVPPDDNVIVRNVCAGKWLEAGWHASAGMLRLEHNLTNAASSLVRLPRDDSPATDFELNANSPAWALGFTRIPVEQIGLRDDELRRGLKRWSEAVRP